MNFDNAKENIQPLACGRDAKRLEIALNAELNEESQKELQRQKNEYEDKIQHYCGDDPLEIWFDYIIWVEQCYPKSGKECSIDELLKKCLLQFGNNSKYFQDSRFIKIYIKFIDTQENPTEIYQQLYNHGIGTMVSDFYIAWAYYYDLMDNFNKANEIFVKGLDARAQPLEELELAQKTFSLSIPPRIVNRGEDDKRKFISSMEEKRHALTSLRAHKHKYVGSLRTGNVIKSSKAGKLTSTSTKTLQKIDNRVVNIFEDTSKKSDDSLHYLTSQPDTSLTRSIIDKARDKENRKEPGPWSKSNKNRSQNVIQSTSGSLAFSIMEDSGNKPTNKLGDEFGIKLPPNFKRSNLPQSESVVPLFVPEERAFSLPNYDKIMVYPGNGQEYSPEEIRAWKYFKKNNVVNQFVLEHDKFWTNEGLNLKARIPPCYPKKNQKQSEFLTEPPEALPNNRRLHFSGWKDYDYFEDFTVEDFLAKKWYARLLKNKTVIMNMSLDETTIYKADDSVVIIDESYFPNEQKKTETPTQSPAAKKQKTSLGQQTSTFACKIKEETVEQPQIETVGSNVLTKSNYSNQAFETLADENVDDQVKPKSNVEFPIYVDSTEPVNIESNFIIFEDATENVFKEPKYTGAIKKCIVKTPQIQETRFQEPLNENVTSGFSSEETFSTQNFVMFIKQQGTSTPLRIKKRESYIPESNEKIPVKIMPSQNLSSQENDSIPKLLSVIMETSETNTGGTSGSGTNTKSSVEENETSKILLNCNQTSKSKTVNNHNLSTILEKSCPRDISEKDASKFTLGLSCAKLIDDSVSFPKTAVTTKELDCSVDELCELFSKTPEKNVKVAKQFKKSPLKSAVISPLSNNQHDSEEDSLDFFKKLPKLQPKTYISAATTTVLNNSVTIPSLKDILLNNKCDTTTNVTNAMGTSMSLPKNQSIMPEFTENMSIFAQQQKTKLASFTTVTTTTTSNLNEDNSTRINKYEHFLERDLGKSIYEPKRLIDDEDNLDEHEISQDDLSFQHELIDGNQTRQQIDNCITSENIDPWNVDLCNAFLEETDFFNYLEKRDDCVLINNVPSLKGRKKIEIADKVFDSIEYISKGAYGFIYKAKDEASGKRVVLKQERPPNCWEYYISIVITERIISEFLSRFMVIDYALIGNNSSIFISDYVQYGTLLDVCNTNYTATSRNLDELIVMVLAIELLTIIDLLHAADIIHGDIKPDNFLLTSNISLDSSRPMLKLIDYGNSIDMQRFPLGTTFKTVIKTDDFICTEMKEGRPWTYQTDLYCLAGTIHVLLFGHYMKTANKLGKVCILTNLPRYCHKTVWERIFTSLLNVPDCQTFPNLQDFKLDLKEILAAKEKLALEKISSFNRIFK